MLLRHWRVWRDRLFSAAKDGKALDFLKEQVAKVRRQTQKAATAIHRRVSRKHDTTVVATTPSDEPPAPIEKKAA
jgi:hypothetical protein